MTTLWCSSCRTEYVEGTVVCADCGAALVAERPPERKRRRHRHEVEGEPRPNDPRDDLVAVATVTPIEAELLAGMLRERRIDAVVFGAGLTAFLGAGVSTEGARVMVRRADAKRATALLGS